MSCPQRYEVIQGTWGVFIAYAIVERDTASGLLVPVDLTLAASSPGYVQAYFKRPDRSIEVRTAVIQGDPADGIAAFQTPVGFLDQVGTWFTEAEVYIPGSGSGRGNFKSRVRELEILQAIRPFSPLALVTPSPVPLVLALPDPLVA